MKRFPRRVPGVLTPAVACLLFGVLAALAGVRTPGILGDHMVLQQNQPVPVWGWADPGATVTVVFAGQTHRAAAGTNGQWLVRLDPLPASAEPRTMSVSASQSSIANPKSEIRNVLVGEVWLASGQSNMELPVQHALNPREEMASANYPEIRLFQVPNTRDWLTLTNATEPASDCEGQWVACSPRTVGPFSAAAYYFGRHLHRELSVPVGLIDSSVGSTRAEFWTSKETLEALENFMRNSPQAACHYNAMIAPLIPYAIRGAVWYQGESNRLQARDYTTLLPALIANWRAAWGEGDFPFGIVQLAPFEYRNALYPNQELRLPEMWEAQAAIARTVPHCGLVVTMDIGDLEDIHPKNKQEVGRRLALWALAEAYGRDLVHSGPLYRGMRIEGGGIRVAFDHAAGGLKASDGQPLREFTIAGSNRVFVTATAEIEEETVLVSSGAVPQPVAVRYAWRQVARPNLANRAGLPASPFRTDDWELVNALPPPVENAPGSVRARPGETVP